MSARIVCVESEFPNGSGGGASDGDCADTVVPAADGVRAARALTALTAAVNTGALRATALPPREAGARAVQAARFGPQGGGARRTH